MEKHWSLIIAAYFIVINIWAFGLFYWDKLAAEQRQWRIRESTLLTISLLGGTIGSLGGREIFRHKTRKQPFTAYLYAIVALHILLIIVLMFPEGRSWLWQIIQNVTDGLAK